jgi:hypothetical protein
MTKKEKLNSEIAKYYGFKKDKKKWKAPSYIYESGEYQWSYPDDFYMAQGGVPNFAIPDFLTILEDYMELLKKHGGFGEREYFGIYDKGK